MDLNPPTGATIEYYVVALDQNPSTGTPREGAKSLHPDRARGRPRSRTSRRHSAPRRTTTRSCSIWDDAPAFTPPYTGSPVIFYRVYPDGTTLGDRIARTGQESLTSYRDIGAAAAGHQYYVTAVDENFSESTPLGPVALP